MSMGRGSFDFCLKRDFVASEVVYFPMTLESIICNVKFEKFQGTFWDWKKETTKEKKKKFPYLVVMCYCKFLQNGGRIQILELQQLKHVMKSNVKSRQPGVLILMLPPPSPPPLVFNESLIISQLLYQISSLHKNQKKKKNDRRPGEQQ